MSVASVLPSEPSSVPVTVAAIVAVTVAGSVACGTLVKVPVLVRQRLLTFGLCIEKSVRQCQHQHVLYSCAAYPFHSGHGIWLRRSAERTALHEAVMAEHGLVVAELLAARANVSAADSDCNTPLHMAAAVGASIVFSLACHFIVADFVSSQAITRSRSSY
jgi:hypothetical protein